MIQDGKRHFFETVLKVKSPISDVAILKDVDNLDGLNYLCGHSVDYVNQKHVRLQGLLIHQGEFLIC